MDNCSAEINRNNLLQDSARMSHSVSIYLSAHERSVTLLSTLNFLPWKPMTNYPPSSLLTYRFSLSPWSKIFDFRDSFHQLMNELGENLILFCCCRCLLIPQPCCSVIAVEKAWALCYTSKSPRISTKKSLLLFRTTSRYYSLHHIFYFVFLVCYIWWIENNFPPFFS